MLALSVSISTSSSPCLTSSPSDLSHLRIVPSSMESDRRGIATSAMAERYTSGRRRNLQPTWPPAPAAGTADAAATSVLRKPSGMWIAALRAVADDREVHELWLVA